MTETENVEIIKALVRVRLGISIIPYQAMAREVGAGQLSCARIAGVSLLRETGWAHPKSNRLPRARAPAAIFKSGAVSAAVTGFRQARAAKWVRMREAVAILPVAVASAGGSEPARARKAGVTGAQALPLHRSTVPLSPQATAGAPGQSAA